MKTFLEKLYLQSKMFHLRKKVPRKKEATANNNYSGGNILIYQKESSGDIF